MPPPSPENKHRQQKPAHRTPLNLDDVSIDFSTVVKPSTMSAGTTAGATSAGTMNGVPAVIPSLLELMQQQQQQQQDDERQRVSDVRAFDPRLQGVAQRQANMAGVAVQRRKKVFGGQTYMPADAEMVKQPGSGDDDDDGNSAVAATTATATTAINRVSAANNSAAAQDALDFLMDAQQQQQGSCIEVQQRREAYMQQLRAFCQRGRTSAQQATSSVAAPAAFPSTPTSHTNSLLTELFADGVPDIEPWDRWTSAMPRYGETKHLLVNPATATAKQIHDAQLDLIHHPVIPDTHYTRHYQYRDLEQPVLQKEYKTKEELRAVRRERLKEKQAKKQRERAAAASAIAALGETSMSKESTAAAASSTLQVSSAASRLLHDRLSTKSLALNLFASSVLNPLAADTKVLQQYELRDLEHQWHNHQRHVAALPNQILKRARDQQRYATEHPMLRVYRIFPIYAPAHLGKLRHYANDNLLRGFVLYVANCDAVIVLTGGEKAVRHLDHWILDKMEWEHADTRATRLATVPLMDATAFSFHLPKASGGSAGGRAYKQRKLLESTSAAQLAEAEAAATEAVFINMVPTVEEGEHFLRQLPAPSSPWADLSAIWRTAFLQDGLRSL